MSTSVPSNSEKSSLQTCHPDENLPPLSIHPDLFCCPLMVDFIRYKCRSIIAKKNESRNKPREFTYLKLDNINEHEPWTGILSAVGYESYEQTRDGTIPCKERTAVTVKVSRCGGDKRYVAFVKAKPDNPKKCQVFIQSSNFNLQTGQ